MILDIDVLLDTVSFIRTLPVIKHWFLKHLWMSDPWVFLDPVLGQHLSKTWWPAYRSWARLSLCHCWCVILMQNISQQQNMWTTDETPIKYRGQLLDRQKPRHQSTISMTGKVKFPIEIQWIWWVKFELELSQFIDQIFSASEVWEGQHWWYRHIERWRWLRGPVCQREGKDFGQRKEIEDNANQERYVLIPLFIQDT